MPVPNSIAAALTNTASEYRPTRSIASPFTSSPAIRATAVITETVKIARVSAASQ
jgi:hypothetical protein